MNYRRWLLVGYLLALMAFTTSVLLIPGEKYDTLTTSDSGWFYDIAADISENHGLVENNRLSRAPYATSVGIADQAQPLITAMLYGGINAINPIVSLMDVTRFWAPLLFALSLIPIFLIGRELGGDFGGCAAAFFGATLTSSIYWHKMGAFDREPIQLILGAWTIYLTIKLFKAPRSSIPKFALLTGMVYGLFGLAWFGALYIAPIIIGALLLLIFSERLRWLSIILTGAFLLLTGFIGAIFRGGGTPGGMINPMYLLIGGLIFAAVIEVFLHKASMISLFREILTSMRAYISLIVGVLGMLAVMLIALWSIGNVDPMFWVGFAQTVLGYIGIGGAAGGVSIGGVAGEEVPPNSWGDTIYRMYGGNPGSAWTQPGNAAVLTVVVFILVVLALAWLCWHKKRGGLLALSWFVILVAMVWPGGGLAQVRFERMWWPFVPALAGAGLAVFVSLLRRVSFEQFGEWLGHVFRERVLTVFGICIVMTAFIFNAYAVAARTTPPTEWHGLGLDEGLMDSFAWLRENTPENSVVAIEWSFGHVMTGVARRASVVDGAGGDFGELGVWENQTRAYYPPDYVYWVEGNEARFPRSGLDSLYRANAINGRRPDVDRLTLTGDENEFANLLRWYRDNYGCKIDYVMFLKDAYYSDRVFNATWLASSNFRENDGAMIVSDGNWIFTFDNQEVILDPNAGIAHIEEGGQNKYLAGVMYYYPEIGSYIGPQFYPEPDVSEFLWVILTTEGDILYSLLSEFAGAPMLYRIYTSFDVPDYVSVAYTSSNGLVKVIKINHVPSLISPAEGTRTKDNTPAFQWSGAVGALKYELWVDDNANFASPEIRESISSTTYVSTSELADGTYSWRVMAFRADGTELGWSPTWVFRVDTQVPESPQLRRPENNAELNTLQTVFAWTEPELDVTYEIQIDDEASFSPPYVHDNSGIEENSYTYVFPHNGTYYWRVQAFDQAGNASEWSEGYKLIIRAPLRVPTLSAPDDGAITNDNTPTFEWAEGNADNYRLLVDDDSEFSSPQVDILLGTTESYTVAEENALPDDNYSWKVIAIVGESQDSSSVWTFVVDTTPPTEPKLHAPENGTTTSDNAPTFEWTVGVGAAKHRLLIGVDPNFSQPVVDTLLDIPENTYTPSPLAGENYWWKVIAIDRAGNESESSVWTFTLQT